MQRALHSRDVAIVGMACRVPGAQNCSEFWRLLVEGRNAIREIPGDRWELNGFYSPDFDTPNRSVSKWGGFLDGVDQFDHRFFNISPREARNMDPQQRLLLEEVWHCLEDAAIPIRELREKKTAVFVGTMLTDYAQEMTEPEITTDGYACSGNISCILANRISYSLGFSGASVTIDTACSASLVALHQARVSLLAGLCDFAVVAGVSLNLKPWKYLSFSKARMLSPEGQCKTFDREANGYVPGEGVGVLLLQLLPEAEAAHNRIHGLLKGSAVNHGGEALSLTAPRVEAQREVVLEAWASAGLSPETCGYVEAHGTGTSLGDPIEVEALTQAFRRHTAKRGYCRIGSVKTNIGHLEPAAGIAGVIKVVLMMKARKIAPTLNVRNPNPLINFEQSPFVLALQDAPWRSDDGVPLRAGVSSFGFGGANSHLVIEEAPRVERTKQEIEEPQLFVLSAKTEQALAELIGNWRQFLESGARPSAYDVCRTLQSGRGSFEHRLAAVVTSWDDIATSLIPPKKQSKRRRYEILLAGVRIDALCEGARWLIQLTREPDLIRGEGEGFLAALAVAGVISSEQDITQPDLRRLCRPRFPLFDPVEERVIWPVRIRSEYLQALIGSLEMHDWKNLKAYAQTLLGTQHTFRKNLEAWNTHLEAEGTTVHQLLENGDGRWRHVLVAVVADALRKLNRKWNLRETLAFGAVQESELLDLFEDGVIDGTQVVRMILDPATTIKVAREAQNARADLKKNYVLLRQFNQELDEIHDVAGWLAEGQKRSALSEDAFIVEANCDRLMLLRDVWAGGVDICWELLHGTKSYEKLDLPLYPFQRERHWIREKVPAQKAEDRANHGMDFVMRTFDPAADPIVRDHRIDGRLILPAAAMIEAMQRGAGNGAALFNFAVHEAVTVSERTEVKARVEGRGIRLETQAKVVATARLGRPGKMDDLKMAEFKGGREIAGGALYDWFSGRGYDYGPALRVIERTFVQSDWMLFELKPRMNPTGDCDPAIIDGVLQAGIVAGRYLGGTKGEMFLPCECEAIQLRAALNAECFVLVRSEKIRTAKRELWCSLEVYSPGGASLASIENVLYREAMRRNEGLSRKNLIAGPDGRNLHGVPGAPDATEAGSGVDLNRNADDLATLKRRLAGYLCEVLDVRDEQLDPETDLREFGLDSVSLTEFAEKIEEKLEVELDPTLLFQYPTLHALAVFLTEKNPKLAGVRPKPVEVSQVSRSQIQSAARGNDAPWNDAAGDDIAIVGIAGRFPGAEGLEDWWKLLVAEKDLITEIPSDRWNWREYFGDPHASPNKSNCRWGGFMTDVDKFDAGFFRISPKEAALMDPQQRLLLEMAWHAIEDAGERPLGLNGSRTGVFIGVCNDDYRELIDQHSGTVEAQTSTGTYFSITSNRISYWFDFHGPSVAVDTACSSSLVTLHQALQAIRSGDCEMALAGGVNICCTPRRYISFSHAGMLSPGGRCKTFDSRADGYVRGEGAGLLFLKPLAKARADGNPVYAIVRGSAVNHGGNANSLTAPNPNAQADLLVTAYRRAGVTPESVGYIEAHGTGTALGDPIEVAALEQAFATLGHPGGRPTCGIGSVKTNIGHLESAAGVAAVIKVLLSLKHQTLPASIHFEHLNPHIDLSQSVFRVVHRTERWEAPVDANRRLLPRRAGVSSFGFGGVNAHVVLEEYVEPPGTSAPDGGRELILLSAESAEQLKESARRLKVWLEAPERSSVALADLAWTLQVGRESFAARLAMIASTPAELIEQLGCFIAGKAGDHFFCAEARTAVLQDDPADLQFLERLFQDGRLDRLAKFWTGGSNIPWEKLCRGVARKRLPVPGYPFKRERHWIVPAERSHSGTGAKEICSTDPLVRDHVVRGDAILPGVVYLGMACAATEQRLHKTAAVIRNVAWLRPFAVNDGRRALRIELEERSGAVSFEAASGEAESRLVHASGMIEFLNELNRARIDLGEIERRCRQRENGGAVYSVFKRAGVDYGPHYDGLKEILFAGGEFLGRIEIDRGNDELLPPRVMDPAVQVTLWWMIREQGADPQLYLPFSAGEIRIHRKPAGSCRVHVIEREVDLTAGFARFDVTLLDQQGNALVELHDFTIRRVGEKASSNRAEDLFFVPSWRSIDCTAEPANWSRLVFTNARDGGLGLRLSQNGGLVYLGRHYDQAAGNCASIDCRLQTDFERVLGYLPESDEICFVGTLEAPLPGEQGAFEFQQEQSLGGLFRLVKALHASGRIDRLRRLTVVSVQAARVAATDCEVNPFGASLAAFGEVLSREHPNLMIRVVDLGRNEVESISALPDAAGRTIAIRDGKTFCRSLRPIRFDGVERGLPFEAGETCLIVGGMGGLGFEAARLLAAKKVNLVLVGRRPADPAMERGLAELRSGETQAIYCAADVGDLEQMRAVIKTSHGSLGRIHGAIHSAIVLRDGVAASMSEGDWQQALRPKIEGISVLANVLREEPIKSLTVFSSVNSFLANGGQSNYVAGCAFKDAFAFELARQTGWRVQVINWGFWGETGIVASEAYRAELERMGVLPLSNAEGIESLERIWSSGAPRVVAGKFRKNFLQELGLDDSGRLVVTEEAGRCIGTEVATGVRKMFPEPQIDISEFLREVDDYAVARVVRILGERGLFREGKESVRRADLKNILGVAPRFERVVDALLAILRRSGVVQLEGEEVRFLRAPVKCQPKPIASAYVRLLDACVDQLAGILNGRIDPLEVVFPNGSPDMVAGIYRGNPVSDYFNELLAISLREIVERRLREHDEKRLRILEVGGGAGGSTERLLRELRPFGRRVEYVFTDLSPALVTAAEKQFGGYPGLEFRVLNIEETPKAGDRGSFDVVIATNVLHATGDVMTTLGNVKALLRRNGLLLLNEVTELRPYLALTFGLLDGWWRFSDSAIRLPHCPLLDRQRWENALDLAGLQSVAAFGDREKQLCPAQTVFLAESDGIVPDVESALGEEPRPVAIRSESLRATETGPDDLNAIVARVIGEAIGKKGEDVRKDARFIDLGIDSIVGIQIINKLNQQLKLSLKTTTLFNYTSLQELVEHIQTKHQPRVTRVVSKTATPARVQTIEPKHESANRRTDGVAIIGMSGRFPGARNADQFWNNLANGVDSIREVPLKRWGPSDKFFDPDRAVPNRSYIKVGGFLDGIEEFDPLFFDISPREAELMDPQQRLFLEEGWKAIEDAGYSAGDLANERCGVFVGVAKGDYFERMHAAGLPLNSHTWIGTETSILTGRIAYLLNLKGPAFPVDTACSSSLVALHLACQSILAGECDSALVGGVFVLTTPAFYVHTSKTLMLSPEGKCKAFDNSADGFVPGEGAAAVLLKPLEKALADGDHIYGVIRATGVNQDGKTNGITAPNGISQRTLIEEVYRKAGVNPETITYVETHGTGTRLGDPIEIEALTEAFQVWTQRKEFCAVGSVKTNIGHSATVAGLAGLMKILLAFKHRQIPPSLHYRTPNESIAFAETPFFVNTELRSWSSNNGTPRRAALSSFGFSGTNAHVLVEEPPLTTTTRRQAGRYLFCISGRTRESCETRVAELIQWLGPLTSATVDAADVSFTLNAGRSHFAHRVACVAGDLEELRQKLQQKSSGYFVSNGPVKETDARAYSGDVDNLARAFVRGASIDWSRLYARGTVRRVSLPTYPFTRMRCWPWSDETTVEEERTKILLRKNWVPSPVSAGNPMAGSYLVILEGNASETLLPRIEGISWIFLREGTELRQLSSTGWEVPFQDGSIGRELWSQLEGIQVQGIVHLAVDPTRPEAALGIVSLYQQTIETIGALRLLLVTRGLQSFRQPKPNLAGAWIAGSLRMLGAEYRAVTSRIVDLDEDTDLHGAIRDELAGADEDVEVCYRGGIRYRSVLEPCDVSSAVPFHVNPERAFVITGGTGGLGFEVARFLIACGVRKLILLSRTAPTGKKLERIAMLRDLGATVISGTPPLSDKDALCAFLDDARRRLGAIGGLFHCAGTAGSPGVPFIRKPLEQIAEVMNPKVLGTLALREAVKNDPIDIFVLFSSVAAVVPDLAVGAADYASANAFMDFFASSASASSGTRFISIQWPSWKETGIGEVTSQKYRDTGMLSLRTAEGLELLERALALRNVSSVLPAIVDRARFSADKLLGSRRPVTHSTPPSSKPGHVVSGSVSDRLAAIFAGELKISRDQLDLDANFSEFGIDSVLLADLVKKIEAELGQPVDPSLLLEHPTINRLAEHLKPKNNIKHQEVAAGGADAQVVEHDRRIAIIGVACRFPGAKDKAEFWDLLRNGHSGIREVPPERWNAARFYHPRGEMGRSISKWGGFVDGIDLFDPEYFGIAEEDAAQMDPLARLFLETTVQTLRDAGYEQKEVWGSATGVFVGTRISTFSNYLEKFRRNTIVGIGQNFIAAQAAQFHNFRGPNLVIDTACSSSLASVHYACQSLLNGECETALAGGVDLLLDEKIYLMLTEAKALSPTGRCHTFDEKADGYVPGEGCGAVLLKPLSKAIADGDRIYGVIAGSAVNNDGHTMGITTPSLEAQEELIRAGLRKAGVTAEMISYIEAHGTGTMIGDPIELKALTRAFRKDCSETQYCAVGSVKTNIGHLHSAAGISSLVKVALMLEAGEIVPTLNCERPNPRFEFSSSPFFPATKPGPWNSRGGLRRAGINSFGFGGTNCHLIVEQFVASRAYRCSRKPLSPVEFKRRRCWPGRSSATGNHRLRVALAEEALVPLLALEEVIPA